MGNVKSGKSIEKKIKFRIIYGAWLFVFGIVSAYVGEFTMMNLDKILSSSCVLLFVGLVTIIRNIRILKDEDALNKLEIYESDERNRLIGLKSWSYTGYIMFLLLYLALMIAAVVNELVMKTILAIVLCFVACLFITRFVLKRVM